MKDDKQNDRQGVALSERDAFESAYAAMLNAKTIAQRWGLSPYTPADIASMRQGNSYQGGHTVLIAGWELWQAAHASFSRPDIEGYKTLLGYVCDAKQAMRERGIPLAQFKDMFPKLLEAFDRASSSRAEVERDAERYRWLRNLPKGSDHGDMMIMITRRRPVPNRWRADTVRGEAMDTAIDAQLAAAEAPKGDQS